MEFMILTNIKELVTVALFIAYDKGNIKSLIIKENR